LRNEIIKNLKPALQHHLNPLFLIVIINTKYWVAVKIKAIEVQNSQKIGFLIS